MSEELVNKNQSFIDRIRIGIPVYSGIAAVAISIYLFLTNDFFSAKVAYVSKHLGRNKIWWIATILVFLGSYFIRRIETKLNNSLIALVVSPIIGFFAAISIFKISDDSKLILELLNTLFVFTFFLLLLAFIASLITLKPKIEKFIAYAMWLILIVLFFGRFIFFEEYFFSRFNDPELFVKIKPLIDRYLLLIVFLFWIVLNMSFFRSNNTKIQLITILVFFAINLSLYYMISEDLLLDGTCKSMNYDCVKRLWSFD